MIGRFEREIVRSPRYSENMPFIKYIFPSRTELFRIIHLNIFNAPFNLSNNSIIGCVNITK